MTLLLTYLILALLISFLCSIAESVLLSVTVSYVRTLESKGSKNSKLLKKFKEDIEIPISSILTFNTIAHTVGAAGVGAQATKLWGDAYFGLVSVVLTLLVLFFTEIPPKSIGARYWRSLAIPVTAMVNVMNYIVYPIVWISKGMTRLISGGKPQEKANREEMVALAEIGLEEGVFEEHESRTIKNLIKSRSIRVDEVMTPRTVVVAISEDISLSNFFDNSDVLRHSRFPVYDKNSDNITGYVLKYDITDNLSKGNGDMLIRDIRRDIVICHESLTVPELFDILLEKKEQIAVLMDEYGGMSGIVTLEDIIETIFGFEIVDERDTQVDMQQLAKDKWRARAESLQIDKMS